jgi:Mce-associated membrane protein
VTDPLQREELRTASGDAAATDSAAAEDYDEAVSSEDGNRAAGTELVDADEPAGAESASERSRRRRPILAIGVAVLAVVLAAAAGYLGYERSSELETQRVRAETVKTATEGAVALLTYGPDTAERDLTAACDRLTGDFRESYLELVREVVIPGAVQKQISTVVTVPAAAAESTSATRAVVLLYVNQLATVGTAPPSTTASSVRVTMDNVDGHWLISDFEPI